MGHSFSYKYDYILKVYCFMAFLALYSVCHCIRDIYSLRTIFRQICITKLRLPLNDHHLIIISLFTSNLKHIVQYKCIFIG